MLHKCVFKHPLQHLRETIGEEVVSEAQEKLRRLKVRRGMSVIPALVYEGRISKRIAADGFSAELSFHPKEDFLRDFVVTLLDVKKPLPHLLIGTGHRA